MNLINFKSGIYKKEYKYQSFLPSRINHTFTWDDPQINTMLEDATRVLGELNAYTMIVPNVDIFIQMHIKKEANTSSKIEGTKTEFDEILIAKEHINPEKRDDWQEVTNYINAMNFSIQELDNLPLSNRLLKEVHKVLLDSVRGETKQPGEFRNSQNWIGGKDINSAYFIPPNHNEINDLMSDFEKFLHSDEAQVPHLIKIAIAHYQFETIHPFLDGNGRIGRLLITLYLVSKNLLKKPSLYLSDFFEKNKAKYYDTLTKVRTQNDISGWIKFFLEAIIVTANNSIDTFKNILALKTDMDNVIRSFGKKAHNASKLVEILYQKPILNTSDVAELLEVSKQTANILINDFIDKNILLEITGYERNRSFAFFKYLDIYSQS